MTISEFLLDKRLVDRYVAKGLIRRDEVRARLAELPDRADNAEVVAEAEAEDAPEAPEAPEEGAAPDPE